MRILITGSNGLLGQKIVAQLLKNGTSFLATSKGENRNPDCPLANYQAMDITNKANVLSVCQEFNPTAIIHTAAMTNVDACESNPEDCNLINITGTQNCFDVAKAHGAQLILLSTDFVFDGENGPYQEDDLRNPLSVYAKSKVEAENILLNSNYVKWSILRTIIVYGTGHNLSRSNIVLWAKGALEEGKELTIVNDQFRAPTWADDLAWACIRTAELNSYGIFNICGPKLYSIYDLVCAIGAHFKLDTTVVKSISSKSLNQAAKRPAKTGFDLTKSKNILGYDPLSLEKTLDLLFP